MTTIFLMSAAPCTYLSNPWKRLKVNLEKRFEKEKLPNGRSPDSEEIMPGRTMIFRTGITSCPFMNIKLGTIKATSYTVDSFSLLF
jgi:hypothetical protein